MTTAVPIALIVGLGNPGEQYAQTRHNAGFWFVDELARRYGAALRAESKFHGEVGRVTMSGRDCHLLKPTTFMNRSGRAVGALAHFYKLSAEQILVVHDEIDLPPGAVKVKYGGGHGGHNGLRDIIQVLGTRDFWRLRLGVGHPGHRDQVVNYVLGRAGVQDQAAIEVVVDRAADEVPLLLQGEFERAMQVLHSKDQPQ